MPELTAGRFFEEYGASMDAALQNKLQDIEPWLVPGLIVDRGCGTASMLKYFARKGYKVVGIEISDAIAQGTYGIIQADVISQVFVDNFVSNILLSSVMHEVYSYNGYSLNPVAQCLANCAKELQPGGRIIIRDIWSPENNNQFTTLTFDEPTFMRFEDYLKNSPELALIQTLDYRTRTVQLKIKDAVEFLSKKHYTHHWNLELQEVYTSCPLSFYKAIAPQIGLNVVKAEPLCNPWIVNNHWQDGVAGTLPEFTNQVIVLEKPQS